jgi:hypothetical protein
MANQATNADSGIRDHRVEFVREDTPGETPADPAWNRFSDTIETALQTEADVGIEAQRGIGDYERQNQFAGPEDSSASIEYHLQHFFVDSSGDPVDASADAMLRADNGGVKSTHTIVDRADHGDTRTYTVVRGGYPDVDDISGDPGSGMPITVSLAYEAKRARSFKVAQPDGTTVDVASTDAGDTSQTVTIEDDGASTSEDVTLNGTTTVTTSESFDSIDAIELSDETAGDVTITDGSGNELARLHGTNTYDIADGDLGIPALGSGSHAGAIGADYERFLDDTISKGGSDLAAEVRSASFSVSNNYGKSGVMGTSEQAIHIGVQDVEFSATVAGDFEEHESITDHLQANAFDLVWTFDGGTVTFADAVITDAGTVGPSAGDVISTIDNTFTPEQITFSAN